MGLGAAAGALLVALGVLGAPPGAGAELSGVLQELQKAECYFINGTEKVRFVERYIYNRQTDVMFDSDVGHYVGFTPYGERNAKRWNSDPEWMEYKRAEVDTYCRHNYPIIAPFSVERRVPPSVSISLGQQELSEHVVATDVVANGDWTYQLLMPPDAGRSKMLTGIGGLVLGSVFLALGLGFYVRKKVRAGAGGGVAAVAEPPSPPFHIPQ
ncbi:LOW QUALITY PROTEIN: DLA class II histocompatibility antigen, DR-1 beta chain-like [Passerculus sandwichensis]